MSIPKTEMRNPLSKNMDKMESEEMVLLLIRANYDAVRACENASHEIARAVDAIAWSFEKGGRLFYVGAGTSGRLGIIDATECPPTFGVPQTQVQGIIAGGNERVFSASENEEDKYEHGYAAIKNRGVSENDVVVGISASGNAKYILGALECAKEIGCVTVGISSNEDTLVLRTADIPIFTDTGAEILTGSTRLKAGTAQKIVLNTLSTCAMSKTGKVYENMMINLSPSNEKLKKRVIRIVSEITDCNEHNAISLLSQNGWNIKKSLESFYKTKGEK